VEGRNRAYRSYRVHALGRASPRSVLGPSELLVQYRIGECRVGPPPKWAFTEQQFVAASRNRQSDRNHTSRRAIRCYRIHRLTPGCRETRNPPAQNIPSSSTPRVLGISATPRHCDTAHYASRFSQVYEQPNADSPMYAILPATPVNNRLSEKCTAMLKSVMWACPRSSRRMLSGLRSLRGQPKNSIHPRDNMRSFLAQTMKGIRRSDAPMPGHLITARATHRCTILFECR
jgi:hypothetical protein